MDQEIEAQFLCLPAPALRGLPGLPGLPGVLLPGLPGEPARGIGDSKNLGPLRVQVVLRGFKDIDMLRELAVGKVT